MLIVYAFRIAVNRGTRRSVRQGPSIGDAKATDALTVPVAFVRGADLNPWHTHALRMLDERFTLTAFGSRLHHFEVDQMSMPVVMRFGLGGLRVPSIFRFLRRWWGRDFIWGLEKNLRGFPIVHTTDAAAGYSYQALKYCQSSGARLVCTVFENIPFVHEDVPRLRRQKSAVRAGVDVFLPVTKRAAAMLMLEGVDESRIRVLDPGIDVTHFNPDGAPESFGLDVPPDAFKILYVGRLVAEKGLLPLMWAVAWLRRRHPGGRPIHFVLAGDGPLRPRLEYEMHRCGLEGHVHFIGPVRYQRLPGLYRFASCLVLPSLLLETWHEQYGMVLAEAMASGRPVVGTCCGAIPEVIGEAGLLAIPGDPFDLSRSLDRLYNDDALCADLGQKGRAAAEQRMDSRQSARKLAEIYSALLEAKSPQPSALR